MGVSNCPSVVFGIHVCLVSEPDPHWESGSKTNMHVLCVCGVHVWAFAYVCLGVFVCVCLGVSVWVCGST